MNSQLRKTGAIVLLIIFISLSAPAMAGSQWETKEINIENSSVTGAGISGDYIVSLTAGEIMDPSGNRIHLYETDTGENRIIGVPSDGMTVTGEGVLGEYAVWFETPVALFDDNTSEKKPNSIYLMNITENTTKVLDLPGDAEWPKIGGGNLFWSNQSGDSFETGFYLYDIKTGKSEKVTTKNCVDPAGIVYESGNIAYEDQKSLRIYNTKSGKDTVVFEFESTNESGTNVDSFDMAGDYLVYIRHTVVSRGDDKGIYYVPCLYTISTGSTEILNPKTGEVSTSLTYDDKKALISSPFTDGKRVGWGYPKSETDFEIILLEPLTGNITTKTTDGSISDIHLDGNRMVWTVSHFPSFHSSLVYAEENVRDENSASRSAPGFSLFTVITSFLLLAIIFIRKRQ